MKKVIISLVAAVIVMFSLTEKASGQFRYGPVIGADLTTLKFKQNLVSVNQTEGFSAGIIGEMMFPGIGFGIDIGMYYQMLGAWVNLGEKLMWQSQALGKERFYIHTLQVPIHLRFKYTRFNGFEEKLAPFAFVGPSFDFTVAHSKIGNTFNFPGGNLCMDFGIGGEIFQRWQVSASYSLGLTYSVSAKILTNYSARNRSWNFRVAYLF
ncbi:MAG: outer membrane beta-barrel protein [Paramuribaculum sp.]|nr:outer membrane beta-barrel protein [Paramuribaculum sp.]